MTTDTARAKLKAIQAEQLACQAAGVPPLHNVDVLMKGIENNGALLDDKALLFHAIKLRVWALQLRDEGLNSVADCIDMHLRNANLRKG